MSSVNGTLGACIDNGYGTRATCIACGHNAMLDHVALAARLGRNHGALHGDLAPILKCAKCGSKRIGLTAIPPDVPNVYR